MDTIVGVVAGILVVLFGLWLGKRRADRMIPPELAEAMRLEKSDPAKSAFLADSYFIRKPQETRRSELSSGTGHRTTSLRPRSFADACFKTSRLMPRLGKSLAILRNLSSSAPSRSRAARPVIRSPAWMP